MPLNGLISNLNKWVLYANIDVHIYEYIYYICCDTCRRNRVRSSFVFTLKFLALRNASLWLLESAQQHQNKAHTHKNNMRIMNDKNNIITSLIVSYTQIHMCTVPFLSFTIELVWIITVTQR